MSSGNIYTLISIDEQSVTPKYVQLTNSILKAIESGKIEKDYLLPSINDLSYELEISRDTAERAYRHLKNLGIIGSVPGKGYFVTKTEVKQSIRIFLLFNKLSTHKKIIYDAFVAALGENAAVDFYIYNNDFALFKKLLNNRKGDYTHYVIIPHFMDGEESCVEIINTLPKERLVLMDKLVPGVTGAYAAVYENFEKDIYGALQEALEKLSGYQTIKIIFPEYTYHPREIIKGFTRFCAQYAFNYAVVNDMGKEQITGSTVYISLMENDLVLLIEKILASGLEVGKDVGVISYNETPLKKIILNGITTISTDFQLMGEKTAEIILKRSSNHLEIPFYLTQRASL
ncbi:MAG TPA: GntR family transcriptional regulator [Chitinophagaceae bacterium]|nr:GntR family transcriptional regulator [Chitinophagaceae bacterium]